MHVTQNFPSILWSPLVSYDNISQYLRFVYISKKLSNRFLQLKVQLVNSSSIPYASQPPNSSNYKICIFTKLYDHWSLINQPLFQIMLSFLIFICRLINLTAAWQHPCFSVSSISIDPEFKKISLNLFHTDCLYWCLSLSTSKMKCFLLDL